MGKVQNELTQVDFFGSVRFHFSSRMDVDLKVDSKVDSGSQFWFFFGKFQANFLWSVLKSTPEPTFELTLPTLRSRLGSTRFSFWNRSESLKSLPIPSHNIQTIEYIVLNFKIF